MEIPDSVKKIGGSAFINCQNLERVYLSANIESIANNAFGNCPNLTMYCPKYSKSMIMLIDNDINCVSNNDKRLESPKVLYEADSYFTITSSANLSVSCGYSMKEEVYKNSSDTSVKIIIPDGATIIDGSLYLDKTLCKSYTERDNYISVPVTEKSGKINFKLETTSDCRLQTYAILNYRLNGTNDYEIIDVINENVDLISLSADDVISSKKIKDFRRSPR